MTRWAAIAVAALACGSAAAEAQGNYATGVAAGEGVVFVAEPENRYRPGMVYVYQAQADGTWAELRRLTAADARAGDGFGNAIATDGALLVAARSAEGDGRGAAYVFERRSNLWERTARLAPADAVAGDSAGIAVAVSGDVVVLGGGASGAGAAYVFRRANGVWTQEAKLTASDGAAGDGFGRALAVSGTRIVVGAPMQSNARGGAYVYDRSGSGWSETAQLVARTVQEGSALGARVALLRDYAIASAPGRDEGTGAVYLFEKNPQAAGWAAFTRLFPYEGSSNSQFGAALVVVGDELWIGSPGADSFAGTVYRFAWDGARRDWAAVRKLSLAEVPPGAGYGAFVAAAGAVAVAGLPGDDQGDGTAVVLARGADGEWQAVNKLWSEAESFPAVTGAPVPCTSGQAATFTCGGMELLSFLPIKDIGGGRGVSLNDVWGWTDASTGREYALVGRTNGTSFVDVTDAANPRYLGDLPMTGGSRANAWRDIKVYRDHAYIVADGAGKHGVQVFDLTRLRNVADAPATFTEDALYDRVYSAHNIVINEQTGMAYAVGSNSGGETCGGGLHMIDIREPKKPAFAGCFSDPRTGNAGTGYSHDAQCVTYSGPHQKYAGREICFGSNETALSIADVTDRQNPIALSRASYPNVQYSHQGWLTEDQRFFYMNDEGDEAAGVVPRTRTIIWDVSDLDDPQFAGEFLGTSSAIDHNLYVVGDTMYQSNYEAGLRMIDISDRTSPREVGFFDSVPTGENRPTFEGSWSNYPYFRSGAIIFTSIREGLFIVKPQRPIS